MDKSDIALQLTLKAMDKFVQHRNEYGSINELNNKIAENVADMYKIIYSSIKEKDN